MRDKIIINTISKVYFIITSLFFFIFLSLSLLFIVLQNGLYIENISAADVKIKQLYIKWNENLDISINEIKITKNNKNTDSKIDFQKISKLLNKLTYLDTFFENIVIEKIIYDDIQASFKYEKNDSGYIQASSPDFTFKSSLYVEDKILHIKIDRFVHKKKNIDIYGDVILNANLQNITSSLYLGMNKDIAVNILLLANKDTLYYKIMHSKK
ncbi:MAG: hypothetical protein JKY28_03080 [Sulfurimonas sp.]|nr:hypothetical protein [Sulfurimonas sp.]